MVLAFLCGCIIRLWSPTDNSPITPYLNTYVEKELLADPANASKHFSKRPTSARVTGTREMEGFLERRRDDGRPKRYVKLCFVL